MTLSGKFEATRMTIDVMENIKVFREYFEWTWRGFSNEEKTAKWKIKKISICRGGE
jgi:hypothetical protein